MRFSLFPAICATLCIATVVPCGAVETTNSASLFPFIIPDKPTSATLADASSWLERPAGAHGFVRARNGHFFAGDKPIRFWGTNLAFNANFPTKVEADVLAEKLARIGVNVIRMHSMDSTDGRRRSLIDTTTSSTRTINKENLDRMDYLVAQLIKRGIYINMNLHVNRTITVDDGVPDPGPKALYSKNLSLYDDQMIKLHQEYASQVLLHKNPYTGHTYADDPGLACVEITNENSFFYGAYSGKLESLTPPYAKLLDDKFNAWLHKNYKSQSALKASWKNELPDSETLDKRNVSRPAFDTTKTQTARGLDYIRFLWETEHAYFQTMRDYLKQTCHVKMAVTGTMEFTLAGAAIQADLMDFTDMHAYWQHPEFATDWVGKWTIGNTPMLDQPKGNALTWTASMRVKDLPYTMSEYTAPWPNFYDAEALPLAAAYGARQDWDGIYIFNYNGDGNFDRKKVYSMFDIDGHPVKTAQMIAGSALFARGDMPGAVAQQVAEIPKETAIETAAKFAWNRGEASLKALGWPVTSTPNLRWALKFTDAATTASTASGTQSPTDINSPFQWTEGRAIVNTPRSLMLASHGTSEPVIIGLNSIKLHAGDNDFGVISVHSMDTTSASISQSKSALLLACGRTLNSGMNWEPGFKSAWQGIGEAPVLTEGLSADISLGVYNDTPRTVYALNAAGEPAMQVPSEQKNGRLTFAISPQYKTIWYIIRQQP